MSDLHAVAADYVPPVGAGAAMICAGCQRSFSPVGRQRFCSEACRVAVYRRYQRATTVPVVGTRSTPRAPIAVYACDGCGARAVDERRCEGCQTTMRRIGLGGWCPGCGAPVAVDELLGQEVIA